MTIKAQIHSDDHAHASEFDATPYFEQAGDDEIIKLAAIDFRGDYPADDVAWHLRETDSGIDEVLTYVEDHPARGGNDAVGFEVIIDADEALVWIGEHRSNLLARISNESPAP